MKKPCMQSYSAISLKNLDDGPQKNKAAHLNLMQSTFFLQKEDPKK